MDLILAGMLSVVLMAGGGSWPSRRSSISGVSRMASMSSTSWSSRWSYSTPVQLTLSFGLTLVLAALSYALLERPFLRLKARFTYIRSAPV